MKSFPTITTLLSGYPKFPLMGEPLSPPNAHPLDFSARNSRLAGVDLSDTGVFDGFVMGQILGAGKRFGFGGYLERRTIYHRSQVFAMGAHDFRNVHLGVDIWAEAGIPVYAPLDGQVHSFQDNAGYGNYGPTIILQHSIAGHVFYSLYGHLARTDLQQIELGQTIPAGQAFCHLGPFPENGDWPPHLHFQLIWDMGDFWGDFPGVCAEADVEYYSRICPDPAALL